MRMRGFMSAAEQLRLLRRTADLHRAARLAAAGRVAEARAIVALYADGRPVAAIEVDRTRPYLSDGKRVRR